MIKLKLIASLCVVMSAMCCYAAEHTIRKSHPVYIVKDDKFKKILDDVIESDKNKSYYTDDLQYAINFGTYNNFSIKAEGKTVSIDYECGVICHSGHNFVILASDANDIIDGILQKTDSLAIIEYWKERSYIDPSGRFVYHMPMDDGQSLWIYNYNNGNYTLIDHYESKMTIAQSK